MMLDYLPMLVPLPLSPCDANRHTAVDDKFSSQHLLLTQPYTVQIIQLVEGPPPPPRIKISSPVDNTSDCYSSSYSSSVEDEDDNESAVVSYCSSDLPAEQSESQLDEPSDSLELSHETFSATKRILAWRENFSAHMSATASEVSLPLKPKRKINLVDDDDTMSQTSKRSRSQGSQGDASVRSLGMHSCPACDTSFMTLQSLRQHGHDAKANEACCVAVEYAFE